MILSGALGLTGMVLPWVRRLRLLIETERLILTRRSFYSNSDLGSTCANTRCGELLSSSD